VTKVTGRCQRCGKACERPLCGPCQVIIAELQAKEQNWQRLRAERRAELKEHERKPKQRLEPAPTKKSPAADPQHRRPNRQVLPMAQPPGVVVRTFKPEGQLQLHRLGKHARFYCVTCRQHKTTDLVATTSGNWKRPVCNTCYDGLIKAKRGKSKNAANPKRHGTQAIQQQSSKARLKRQNVLPTNPATAKGEVQERKRRQSAVDRLLGFFRDAGVDAELGRDGYLWINGSQTEPLAHLPSPDTPEWINKVNEIAVKYVRDKFIRAVEDNACFGDSLRTSLLPHAKGFAIMRGDVRLAVIHPTHTFIPHRPFIYANFLTPGPHWRQVANLLHDAEARLVAGSKQEQEANAADAAVEVERSRTAARWRIDQLPHDLDLDLIDACLDASRRIRLDRQVAYERQVVLEYGLGDLTLLPLAGTANCLRMPFRLSKGMETLKGHLLLGDRDPLPLVIWEDVAYDDAITAWTWALLGFADATCFELEPAARREPARQMRLASSVHRRPHSTRTLPRRQRWPTHLEPVGPLGDYTGSFVAGHRRRLPDDQTASGEASYLAHRVGIILHPHETWVRPHTRGVPDGIEMRFRWHAPVELSSSVHSP
jgi:hypothetical protein